MSFALRCALPVLLVVTVVGCGDDASNGPRAEVGEIRPVEPEHARPTRESWSAEAREVCDRHAPILTSASEQNHEAQTPDEIRRAERRVARVFQAYYIDLAAIPRPGNDRLIRRYVTAMRNTASLFRAIHRAAASGDRERAYQLTQPIEPVTDGWTKLQNRLNACPSFD